MTTDFDAPIDEAPFEPGELFALALLGLLVSIIFYPFDRWVARRKDASRSQSNRDVINVQHGGML